MNYEESLKILEEVKKAKKILINCHRGPDPDSIGCALALSGVVKSMDKDVLVISPDPPDENVSFLEGYKDIKQIDFADFDFDAWDLFICLDSSSQSQITGSKEKKLPSIPTIVIDHHTSNEGFGLINLVDTGKISCTEVLYLVFEDWRIEINKDVAEALLTGILSDSGIFRHPAVTRGTFEIALKLMDKGADREKIVFHIYDSIPFEHLKIWGEIFEKLEYEKEYGFYWSALSFDDLKKHPSLRGAREILASLLGGAIAGSDFSVIMVEEKKDRLSMSFRGRTSNVDVAKMAAELGGGGHSAAAGARIEGLKFEEAVQKVLEVARKHAKKTD